MKKSLNLYHASCQPEKIKFNFSQIIVLFIACVLLIGITQSWVIHRSSVLEDNQLMAEEELINLQNELSALVIKMQANRAPEEKVEEKVRLEFEVSVKQRLLSNLNQIDLGLEVSFSQLLLGLSKADVKDVSISRFSIKDGKLDIQGQALHSDSVPHWLTNIQSTTELDAVSFTSVDISQQDKIFLFQLSNIGLNKKSKDKK
ncbi:PilN domain-containing protein [Psychromonas sp.]|nr:PilN domain-containing protein [Psychromonas sp.]